MISKPQVRIESDGTTRGTRILVDGVPLSTVTKVSWSIDSFADNLATCQLELVGVDVAVTADEAKVTRLLLEQSMRTKTANEKGVIHDIAPPGTLNLQGHQPGAVMAEPPERPS